MGNQQSLYQMTEGIAVTALHKGMVEACWLISATIYRVSSHREAVCEETDKTPPVLSWEIVEVPGRI